MRRQDKDKNIEKANLILEQSYLKSKGLINENINIGHIIKSFGGEQKGDMNKETQAIVKDKLVTIEGDVIEITDYPPKFDLEGKMPTVIKMNQYPNPQELYEALKDYLS
jgi:hypothetical protein